MRERGKMTDFQPEIVTFSIREDALWLPIYTRPLHEFKLYDHLCEHGIPAYLPVVPDFKIHRVVKGEKQHSYRREVMRPMLKSYVFAQLTFEQRKELWKTDAINNIWKVSPEEQPTFIEELRGLQMMEVLARTSKLEYKKEIQVNDRFIIEAPREFEGTYGYLIQKRKKFLWVVKLEFLNQCIDVEIDPSIYKMSKID